MFKNILFIISVLFISWIISDILCPKRLREKLPVLGFLLNCAIFFGACFVCGVLKSLHDSGMLAPIIRNLIGN